MSQVHHLKDVVSEDASKEVETLTARLREEKDKALAQGKELKSLQLKLKSSQESEAAAAAENVTLTSRLDAIREEVDELNSEKALFEDERLAAVSGARMVARWELMREWLKGQTDNWDLATEFSRCKLVRESEAELCGMPPPSFDDEPLIPVKETATGGTPCSIG